MKIVFIRHGDPNYELDALTQTGIKEAQALIPRMEKIAADHYYVSPLGRAKQTAEIAMEKIDKEAVVLDWLKEFPPVIRHICEPNPGPQCWDWMPSDWAEDPGFYDIDTFFEHPVMKEGQVKEIYQKVICEFDKLLIKHGYKKSFLKITIPCASSVTSVLSAFSYPICSMFHR